MNVIGEPIRRSRTDRASRRQPRDSSGAPLPYTDQFTSGIPPSPGIKVVDLLGALCRRAGKIGLFGGAGVGKTVLIQELINNVASAWRVFGVRRRRRCEPAKARPLSRVHRIESQRRPESSRSERQIEMRSGVSVDETSRRAPVPASASPVLPVAEHFRDQGQDVLFFVDNIFRLPRRVRKCRAASAVFLRPCISDARHRHGRAAGAHHTTHKGSITSVQAIYVPADD